MGSVDRTVHKALETAHAKVTSTDDTSRKDLDTKLNIRVPVICQYPCSGRGIEVIALIFDKQVHWSLRSIQRVLAFEYAFYGVYPLVLLLKRIGVIGMLLIIPFSVNTLLLR